MSGRALYAGDRVVVRSPKEILSTLDAQGTLDGLPFMPEMVDWCGKAFRVERRVEKICIDSGLPEYPHRRFAANDVVVLEQLRCDGRAHDGCKRGCKILWKADWLRPADSANGSPESHASGRDELLARLKTKVDESHYFCLSTQLFKATVAFPGRKKPWMLRILLREIRNGDRFVSEVLKLVIHWFSLRLHRVVYGKRRVQGPHKQTPTTSLGLKPGDPIRIKSRAEIVATLSPQRTNRGMGFCLEMTKYCGANAEVRDRLDRMISERTGEMLQLRDTVTLRNVRCRNRTMSDSDCLCEDVLGDCPRAELMYWREVWLERS